MDSLEIEFRPHVARRTPLGDVIEFDQWYLMVKETDGRFVQYGYVSKKDGGPIHLIRRVTNNERGAIHAAVEKAKGPRAMPGMPPILAPEMEEDEDDDNE